MKERAEKLESWREKEKLKVQKKADHRELLRKKSSMWVAEDKLETTILDAIKNTTALWGLLSFCCSVSFFKFIIKFETKDISYAISLNMVLATENAIELRLIILCYIWFNGIHLSFEHINTSPFFMCASFMQSFCPCLWKKQNLLEAPILFYFPLCSQQQNTIWSIVWYYNRKSQEYSKCFL